jgi:hypothetical protein
MVEKDKFPMDTQGGAIIDGDVTTEGGDFVGRDKIELNIFAGFRATPGRLRRSFDALLQDKLSGFVGRQFVFAALDQFLETHNSGYFIIQGNPGIGKSALVAKLVNDRGYIHHFNIASQNIRSPRAFLESVCAQIIDRYELPADHIPPSAFEDSSYLVTSLQSAIDQQSDPDEKIVIAIDALDESDRQNLPAWANLLYLPASLPDNVYIVLTTRPLADIHLQVSHFQIFDLDSQSTENMADIEVYIQAYLQRQHLQNQLDTWGVTPDQFLTGLGQKSQGNFMYLYHVLPAIERGDFVQGSLAELPEGLIAYYHRHWRQMRRGAEQAFEKTYAPIVCILGVAREPITLDQISNWTQLSLGTVKHSLRLWREFLDEEHHSGVTLYRIYHASFQDFLQDQVDLEQYEDVIIEYYLSLAYSDDA